MCLSSLSSNIIIKNTRNKYMSISIRQVWCNTAFKLCFPVLNALSQRKLKQVFIDKKPTAHLEALCRVLVGIAPWMELGEDVEAHQLLKLSLVAIASITDPFSDDYIDFSIREQVLVEGAILCQALNRGYLSLWCSLPLEVKKQVIISLKKTRKFKAHDNNLVLFPSMIEAFLMRIGEDVKKDRLWNGLKQYNEWYKGDGVYGDGEEVHMDYYNSYIIHPMLVDILSIVKDTSDEMKQLAILQDKRLKRWATLQERMIAIDGTFPPLGRSLTYRCGAFHGLALSVYKGNLDDTLKPAQVRVALTRLINATLEHPETFEDGWLTVGLYGKQPGLAEPYINHGSVYICSTVFLPLGLPSTSMFWIDNDEPTTWERVLNGEDIERDKPYIECLRKYGKCV